ncbi:unnamed protein product, partial [Effrenium voratum]
MPQMELLTWFPANTVTCLCPIGTGLQVCASADEGGRLRLWQVIRGDDPKGFRLLRFASAVTSLTAESRGKFLLAGTDSGCIHAVAADPWTEAQVIDTQRISEVGIAKLCSTLSEDGLALKVAALLFDGRIAMASFSLREPKVRMLGLVENIGLVEDICFHEQEKAEDLNMPAKLLAVGSQTADVACMWSIRSPTEGYEPRELTIPREATGFWTVKLSSDTMEGRPTAICSISRNQAVVGFASGAVRIYSTPTHVGLMVKPNAANPVKSLLEPDTHHLITSLQMNLSATTLLVGCMACSCRDYHAEEVLHQGDSSITIVTSTDFLTKDNIITMREYVANVENYSLLIEPTIYQVNKKPTGRNLVLPGDEIQGRLFVGRLGAESTREQQELCQEKALQPDGAWAHPEGQPTNAAPCYVLADTQVNGNDVFKVSTLLRSMGKSLDSMEGKDWKKNITRNLRDSGLSVLLSLRVHSYQPGKGLIKPYYVLDLQAEGDSRQYFSIWSVDTKANGQREYRHEHGFRMEIAASGTFANYSTADLLDNFTNGMALLAFSAIAVKFIAIYFCPLGQVYKRAMTRDTPEGQDLEKLMDADFEEVKSKHQELYSHQTGTKEEMGDQQLCKTLHSPYNGGTAQVVCSRDGTVAMSTGGADGILVWSDAGSDIKLIPDDSALKAEEDDAFGEELPGEFAFELDDTDVNAFPAWVAVGGDAGKGEDEEVELSEEAATKRKLMSHEIEALRKKLRILIDHNSNAPDLEKLERGEFCVDFEERYAIASTTKERCDALRAEIEHQNVARQLIRDRLIKEFWDPMRGKGCQITSLTSGLAVSNYPERTVSEDENTVIKKLRMLRKTEQLEYQMCKGSSCPSELRNDMVLDVDSFTTGEERYIVNWWPGAHTKAAEARSRQLDAEAKQAA